MKAENLNLLNRINDLQSEIQVLRDREETLQYTSGIQGDEILRLLAMPEEKVNYSGAKKLQDLTGRIDQIKLYADEKEQTILTLRSELESS